MLGLYLHFPFCSAICNYCNFNRGLFDAALKARYVDALVAEIRRGRRSGRRRPASGRHHLLRRRHAVAARARRDRAASSRLPRRVRRRAPTRGHARGQPRDASTTARLAAFRAAGVNRLSFGVQSFRDDELRRLSRLHTRRARRAAVAEARARRLRQRQPRPDDVAARPAASTSGSSRSTRAIALGPEHLSLYMLEVYPNAPLKDEMARARWSQAPDDDAAAMYLTAMERLEAAGLRAVRDLERRAAGPAVAPQPEVLDRRRVARVRLRRAFDAGRRAVEECRRPPTTISTASPSGRDRRRTSPPADRATSGWATRCSPACG